MGIFKKNKNKIVDGQNLENKKSKKLIKIEKKIRKKNQKRNKYIVGMSKSRHNFLHSLKSLYNKHQINEEFFEELEEILIMNDISMNIVMEITDAVRDEVTINKVSDPEKINEIIVDKMFLSYANKTHSKTTLNLNDNGLSIILVVGINGVGKTTSIAKLTNLFKEQNKKVTLAAGDTFRAGAVEQLSIWADRLEVECVKPSKNQQDPSSVIFDSIKKAQENNSDILICDTSGRMHNKVNLMNELNKISRTITKNAPNATLETLLVLDATTGQNGIAQAKIFKKDAKVDGIILTKMDGSSKGGIVLTIKDTLNIDVKFIGLGEKVDDLAEFDLEEFVNGLTKEL